MKILQTLQHAFLTAWSLRRFVTYWYIVTLVLALLVVLPVRSFMSYHVGDSLSLSMLEEAFSYTFLNDFRVNYGSVWLPDGPSTFIVAATYWLLALWVFGGLLGYFKRATETVSILSTIIQDGRLYFRRMVGLSIAFIALHVLLLALVFFAYYTTAKGFSMDAQQTERLVFGTINWFLGGYLILALLLLVWQDFSKIALVQYNHHNFFQSIRVGFRNSMQHIVRNYLLYGLFALLTILLFIAYFSLKKSIPTQHSIGLLAFIILTQLWLWVRLWLKVALLAGVWQMGNDS